MGFEPMTYGLRGHYSTSELLIQIGASCWLRSNVYRLSVGCSPN
jgi:hypothetical protein